MEHTELPLFSKGLEFVAATNYKDAATCFESLILAFPQSDLADDAAYNIALCLYEMNKFEEAIKQLRDLLVKYPNATIYSSDNMENGRTSAKAYYLMINCYLGQGNPGKAHEILPILEKYPDSYILQNGKMITFHELAKNALQIYDTIVRKK